MMWNLAVKLIIGLGKYILAHKMDIQGLLQDNLLKGEKIEWHGQPDASVIFSAADIRLIPFSLMFLGFSIYWEYGALSQISRNGSSSPFNLIFPLFGIPFILHGIHFAFGRFFYKIHKKKQTYYVITNQRLLSIVAKTPKSKSVNALFINTIPVINIDESPSGVGTVSFGFSNPATAMYENTGLDSLRSNSQPTFAFYDLKEANTVYQLLQNLRKQA